jgi:hypothetical protein
VGGIQNAEPVPTALGQDKRKGCPGNSETATDAFRFTLPSARARVQSFRPTVHTPARMNAKTGPSLLSEKILFRNGPSSLPKNILFRCSRAGQVVCLSICLDYLYVSGLRLAQAEPSGLSAGFTVSIFYTSPRWMYNCILTSTYQPWAFDIRLDVGDFVGVARFSATSGSVTLVPRGARVTVPLLSPPSY